MATFYMWLVTELFLHRKSHRTKENSSGPTTEVEEGEDMFIK